jgi:pyruvate/2-oxoglutarate dehydrogenase complex dihydrolipoamide acyltransferase (E2) component
MNKHTVSYHVVDLSPSRRVIMNLLDLPRPKHCMYGLLEVDVTIAKQFIEDYKAQTGELLSFTGYLTYCLARAVDEDKTVQGYLKGHKQLVLFDDVNVGLMVERKSGDKRVLSGYVIQAANHKTYREIHQEIRAVQATPPPKESNSWFYAALLWPWPFPMLFRSCLGLAARRDPTLFASMAGTVGVTAVGMFGEGQGGWGIAPVQHTLGLIVGSTAWKPAIVDGRIEPREILHLTVTFDHNIIDGAPAARFTRRLVELIESGYGLVEAQRSSEQRQGDPGDLCLI